jgi:hypothetical protein
MLSRSDEERATQSSTLDKQHAKAIQEAAKILHKQIASGIATA